MSTERNPTTSQRSTDMEDLRNKEALSKAEEEQIQGKIHADTLQQLLSIYI